MHDSTSLPDKDDIRLLTEIGFLASARGDVARAEIIFGALLLSRPNEAFPHIGLATALMNAHRPGEAASLLAKAIIPTGDDADMVQAMRGLALQLDGQTTQSTSVLDDLISARRGEDAQSDGVRLALKLLGK